MLLQGAIDKARMTDSFWIETDTADVALLFASVLKDVGKIRLAHILLGGPTVSNFLNVAKRTIILTVKGHAVMRDINRVLTAVDDDTIDKADAWRACENRTAMNRNTLHILTGGPTLSSTSFVAPALDGVAPVLAEGWMDEKQMITEGWAGDPGSPAGPMDGNVNAGTQTVELDFIRGGDDEIILADWSVGPQIIDSTETMLSAFGDHGYTWTGGEFDIGDPGSFGIGMEGGGGGTGPFVGGTDFIIAEYDIITPDWSPRYARRNRTHTRKQIQEGAISRNTID